MNLEAYELVLLRRPADATPYDDDILERIQREHIAYHASLRAAGDVVTNGPVVDQPDESLRGLTFYRTGSLQRARELAEVPRCQGGTAGGRCHAMVVARRNDEETGPPHLPRQ